MTERVPRSYFDVVVIGGALGALAAGALLARRGFRVLWLRHDTRPNVYQHEGLSLLRAPNALTFIETPPFRRVLGELALLAQVRRKLSVADPQFQVVLPEHRMDIRAGGEAMLEELSREFPEVRRPAEEFYALVARANAELDALTSADLLWPPNGFFSRRASARAAANTRFGRRGEVPDPLGDLPADHALRTFVHAQARFSLGLDPDAMTPLGLLRAHGPYARNAMYLEGGRDALATLLRDKIVQYGGELRARDVAQRIVVQRRRVRGVDLITTDERIGCRFVITGMDAAQAFALTGVEPTRSTAELLMARAPRYYRYTLNVVLPADAVPVGMGSRVFAVMDRTRPLAEENLLAIEQSPRDAEGRVLLTITSLLPRAGVDEGETYLRKQRSRVLRALSAAVPFLERNLIVVDSPHDGLPLDDHARRTTAPVSDRWNSPAEPMSVIEAPDPRSFLGLCTLPPALEIDGLHLAGPQPVAGLGEEGELLSALTVAATITRTDPTKEKMRRELWSKADY